MNMEQWARVRQKVLVDQQSKRSVMAEEGLHWETLQKMLKHPEPPGYKRRPTLTRKIDPHREWIRDIIEADRKVHHKQRHTALRLFERLQRERGYKGGYTAVKELVAEIKATNGEVYMPLSQPPGEAQVDFGHALVNLNGTLTKCPFFVMTLSHSDAFYVQVFERECTETFWEGHVRAFEHFGAVPSRISYDNTSIAVSQVLKRRQRKLTDSFLQLQSHYLFKEHFCLAARGNEKGIVERIVGYSRANFLVPVPQVRHLTELNTRLETACLDDRKRQLRGKSQPKETLLKEDLKAMHPLPAAPFEACRIVSTQASSLSLVRFDNNDYSIPARYGHHQVIIKGSSNHVRVYHEHALISEHERCWEKEQVLYNPVHYLSLLKRKPGALDFGMPFEEWELPESLYQLRRRLEAVRGDEGKRDYISILCLLEKHPLERLAHAVKTCLDMDCLSIALIEQTLYREDPQAKTFKLDGHEHLRGIHVATTDPRAYTKLLTTHKEKKGAA